MLICFEGIAGSGKSTQVNLLAPYLESASGKKVFISAVYEGARREAIDAFMNVSGIQSDQRATMFLFQALHAVQYREAQEALDSGKLVIADRWRYSFFAHHIQQDTFGDDDRLMRQIDLLAFGSLKPDLCFLIDVPADIAYRRYLQREGESGGKGLDLMNLEYFIAVTDYYRKIARDNGWHSVDGTKNPMAVFEDIKLIVNQAK